MKTYFLSTAIGDTLTSRLFLFSRFFFFAVFGFLVCFGFFIFLLQIFIDIPFDFSDLRRDSWLEQRGAGRYRADENL